MPGQAPDPLFTLEDLLRPVEPLPADIDRPVFKRTHEQLLHKLVVLEESISLLRKGIEVLPRHDVFVDGLRVTFARLLDEAGAAYTVFMETRDCEGEH